MFSNTYTPSLARQCLAVGLYPFRNGYKGFHTDLEPGAPTFTRWFAEHGYYTACCGKLHHRGPDLMQGWLQRIGSETAVRLRHFCAIGAEEFCPAPLSSKRRPRRGRQPAGQGLQRCQMPAPPDLALRGSALVQRRPAHGRLPMEALRTSRPRRARCHRWRIASRSARMLRHSLDRESIRLHCPRKTSPSPSPARHGRTRRLFAPGPAGPRVWKDLPLLLNLPLFAALPEGKCRFKCRCRCRCRWGASLHFRRNIRIFRNAAKSVTRKTASKTSKRKYRVRFP